MQLFGIVNLAKNLLILKIREKGQTSLGIISLSWYYLVLMLETSKKCTEWLQRLLRNDHHYFTISPYFHAAREEMNKGGDDLVQVRFRNLIKF